ncbi:MAG: glycosyltransferase [Pseudomonadota bacterium]
MIVTSYNHAEYLDKRMESLLKQTYGNREIIVVDDCSTDGSLAVLDKYRKEPKIKVFPLEKNGGYANACNFGVNISHGAFIMFAECDDHDEPEHVEILMERLKENESAGVAYCKSYMIDGNGKVFGDDFYQREKSFRVHCAQDALIPQGKMQKFFLKSCVIPNMSAAIIRKRYFRLIGGFDSQYKACADWDFWCRLSEHCDFYYVAKPLNYFRTHASTVRNSMGIATPVLETFALLYKAYAKVNLTFIEAVRFKINLASKWTNYINDNPLSWLRSLPQILSRSIGYDRFAPLYLALALIRKIYHFALRLIPGQRGVKNGHA